MPREALRRLLDGASHNPSINAVREANRFAGPVIDFCVPVNPYFPTPELLARLQARLPDLLVHYPDLASVHEQHIATIVGVPADHVVVANGSTELITTLCRNARGPWVTTVPTFGRWTDLPAQWGTPLHTVAHRKSRAWRVDVDELIDTALRTRAAGVVLCNPNNPTGAGFTHAEILRIVGALSALDAIVIDESFLEFSELRSARHLAVAGANVVVVTSMGKALGWHGVRLGYAVARPETAASLRAQLPWWNVNGVAAFVLKELAQRPEVRAAYADSFARIAIDREHLRQQLSAIDGLTVYPSQANFLYVELPPGVSGKALRVELLERHGVYVRECSNKIGSSESFLRLAVLPAAQADRLAAALSEALS